MKVEAVLVWCGGWLVQRTRGRVMYHAGLTDIAMEITGQKM